MNTDHADDLLALARVFGGHPDATSALAEAVDPDGIDLTVETPRGPATTRVNFAKHIDNYPVGLRPALARLARQARRTG